MKSGTRTISQLARVGTGGQDWKQLSDPVVEGKALLEEDAVDLGTKAAVGRDQDRGQRQREHDLAGSRVDSHDARRRLGEPLEYALAF